MYSKIKKITLWFITLLAISFMSCSNGFDDNNTENASLPSGYYVLADKSAYIQVSDATGYLYEYDSSVLGYKKMDLPLAISLSGSTVYFSWSTTVNSQTFSGKISGTYTESTKSVMITAVDDNSKDYAAVGSIYTWQNAVPVYSGSDDDTENTDNYAFSAPTNVTVSASTTKNTVTVKWSDVSDSAVEYYYIYYSTSNDTSSLSTPAARTSLSGSYGKDISLSESGTYYFWVKAADAYSSENTSDFSSVATYEFTYNSLTAPIDISAVQSETSYNNVTVIWRDSQEAYKYYIYYNTTNDSSTATKVSGNGYVNDEYDSSYNKTGFYKGSKDVALSESGTYYFWVKAVDGTNHESEFSTVATFTLN